MTIDSFKPGDRVGHRWASTLGTILSEEPIPASYYKYSPPPTRELHGQFRVRWDTAQAFRGGYNIDRPDVDGGLVLQVVWTDLRELSAVERLGALA